MCIEVWEVCQFRGLEYDAQITALEFCRSRKMMIVRCRRSGKDTLFVKGAPEAIYARCTDVRVPYLRMLVDITSKLCCVMLITSFVS